MFKKKITRDPVKDSQEEGKWYKARRAESIDDKKILKERKDGIPADLAPERRAAAEARIAKREEAERRSKQSFCENLTEDARNLFTRNKRPSTHAEKLEQAAEQNVNAQSR